MKKCAVIFGGAGFIGVFFARQLLVDGRVDKVYLFDLQPLKEKKLTYREKIVSQFSSIIEVVGDVRTPIKWQPEEEVLLVGNFAAVHREPGHEPCEYYETNLLGANHVCEWAETVSCSTIIFTSSIAPYGASEKPKDESSVPVPTTAYGGSKLVAEQIHQTWLAKDINHRNLIIVRPGVVFGPGEGGNVTRLIKAVLGRYFFYAGNKDTRKAGVYVKELCAAILWSFDRCLVNNNNFTLFNMTMHPGPSVEDYVDAVLAVSRRKQFIPQLPYRALLISAYMITFFARLFNISHPFSPVRIKKLVKSNNIVPRYLIDHDYPFRYTLISAFEDWKNESPEDWS